MLPATNIDEYQRRAVNSKLAGSAEKWGRASRLGPGTRRSLNRADPLPRIANLCRAQGNGTRIPTMSANPHSRIHQGQSVSGCPRRRSERLPRAAHNFSDDFEFARYVGARLEILARDRTQNHRQREPFGGIAAVELSVSRARSLPGIADSARNSRASPEAHSGGEARFGRRIKSRSCVARIVAARGSKDSAGKAD